MFKLFQKKEGGSPGERIARCVQEKDYAGLARAYYELGVSAMKSGDQGRAMLWLSRADTVYSARDEVYDKVGEKITDDCSDRIGELEDAPLPANQLSEQIIEKAEELGDVQVRVWSLLTLARLAPVGEKLSALPGCGALGALGRCADLALRSFQESITQEEFQWLKDVCSALYDLSDAEAFFAGGEVPCAAGAPLEAFDLNGLETLLSIEGFLDGQLRNLAGDPVDDDGSLIPCALLPDYYTRTVGGDIRQLPQVKAELERVWSDCEFVCSGPTWQQVAQRMEGYKALDIFSA